jgi:hypothetical protein
MADKKISELDALASWSNSLPFPTVEAGITKQVTGGTIFENMPLFIGVACSDETTALTTGTKAVIHLPYDFTLTEVIGALTSAQASGSIFTADINKNGTSILSTKLTIDNGEETSITAATPAVISDTNLPKGTKVSFDIDQVGTGGRGYKAYLVGRVNL